MRRKIDQDQDKNGKIKGIKDKSIVMSKKLVGMLELPKEAVFNMPIIHALGDEDVSITNYKGLVEYGSECIRINTASGQVRFEGTQLILKQVTSEVVSVSGRISKIEFN